MADLAATVEELREDREHGASWMARRTVEALVEVAQTAAETPDALIEELTESARQLAESRPRIGAIAGAAGRVLAAAHAWRHLDLEDFRRLITEEGASILAGRDRAAASIAIQLADRVGDAVVATHSASATVQAALVRTPPARVICTVSEPIGEGRAFADTLRGEGLNVDLVADDDAPAALRDAGLLLVGADTVFRCGTLCNKIGTTRLAEAARDAGIPVVVAAEVVKLAPIVAEEAPDAGAAERDLFELTPPDLLTEIVTEEGSFTPDEVAALADRTPFLREGYALLQPAAA